MNVAISEILVKHSFIMFQGEVLLKVPSGLELNNMKVLGTVWMAMHLHLAGLDSVSILECITCNQCG